MNKNGRLFLNSKNIAMFCTSIDKTFIFSENQMLSVSTLTDQAWPQQNGQIVNLKNKQLE